MKFSAGISRRAAVRNSEHVKRRGVYGVERLRMKEFAQCNIAGDLWGRKRLASSLRQDHQQRACESFRL